MNEDQLAEHIHNMRSGSALIVDGHVVTALLPCGWDFDAVVIDPIRSSERPGDPLCQCRMLARALMIDLRYIFDAAAATA